MGINIPDQGLSASEFNRVKYKMMIAERSQCNSVNKMARSGMLGIVFIIWMFIGYCLMISIACDIDQNNKEDK